MNGEAGKGDRICPYNRKRWDEGWNRAYGEKEMNRPRYSPRLTGAGKQIAQQAIDKDFLKVILTPTVRAIIKKECNCTDADIDKGIEDGTIEWIDEFKKMLAKQRAEMVPPAENDNES